MALLCTALVKSVVKVEEASVCSWSWASHCVPASFLLCGGIVMVLSAWKASAGRFAAHFPVWKMLSSSSTVASCLVQTSFV